jgi:hypothetical protein
MPAFYVTILVGTPGQHLVHVVHLMSTRKFRTRKAGGFGQLKTAAAWISV